MSDSDNSADKIENRFLAVLPTRVYKRLAAQMDRVRLSFGSILYEPGDPLQYAYFPNDSIISLLSPVEDRSTLEVGIIGNEGVVGLSALLGVRDSPNRAIVQGAGSAMRIKTAMLLREARADVSLQRLLNRQIHALMTQISQSAVCNRFHRVDARLARWLLMTRDRSGSDEFRLTHDFLSDMLGVRRVGVTNSATVLQRKKLIEYSRGHITILDLAGLNAVACSCYSIVKDEYDSFLGIQASR